MMQVSKKLLDKYNIPVPRYTSYPPANYFQENFPVGDYKEGLRESNNWAPDNISFYIHIPFCRRRCFYCGCNSCLTKSEEIIHAYIQALKKEINMAGDYLDKQNRKVSQIHYGGGTPNSLDVSCLKEINDLFFKEYDFIDQPEIAIECHPAYLNESYIENLKESGFNRFSIGIQDFKADVLKLVNRQEPAIPVEQLVSLIKKDNPKNGVNLDFIYGLPGQTVESFSHTIRKAIEMKPDRLVTFSYAHVPWVNKAQEKLEEAGLPDHHSKIDMFRKTYDLMIQNGYQAIGMDHYALKEDELSLALNKLELHRNFQGYCTLRTTGQVYAFGVSGISQLERLYAQNTKSVDEYIETLKNNDLPIVKGYKLNEDERIRRALITDLMCNKRLNWQLSARNFDLPVDQLKLKTAYNEASMREFEADHIIQCSDDELNITDTGEMFIRNVAAALDPLMKEKNLRFSKPV